MEALLAVDLQNDFCPPAGTLAVPEGDTIVPLINRLMQVFDHTILTQDWHPAHHLSFASSHPEKQPFQTIELPYGEQILWPDHCVQGSTGAAFRSDLEKDPAELILRKGFRREIDSYSAFYENDHVTPTGLTGYLRERGINRIYLAGLATDFCVHWSAVDGCKEGFEVLVIEDATRGIDTNGSLADAWEKMKAAGAQAVQSKTLLDRRR